MDGFLGGLNTKDGGDLTMEDFLEGLSEDEVNPEITRKPLDEIGTQFYNNEFKGDYADLNDFGLDFNDDDNENNIDNKVVNNNTTLDSSNFKSFDNNVIDHSDYLDLEDFMLDENDTGKKQLGSNEIKLDGSVDNKNDSNNIIGSEEIHSAEILLDAGFESEHHSIVQDVISLGQKDGHGGNTQLEINVSPDILLSQNDTTETYWCKNDSDNADNEFQYSQNKIGETNKAKNQVNNSSARINQNEGDIGSLFASNLRARKSFEYILNNELAEKLRNHFSNTMLKVNAPRTTGQVDDYSVSQNTEELASNINYDIFISQRKKRLKQADYSKDFMKSLKTITALSTVKNNPVKQSSILNADDDAITLARQMLEESTMIRQVSVSRAVMGGVAPHDYESVKLSDGLTPAILEYDPVMLNVMPRQFNNQTAPGFKPTQSKLPNGGMQSSSSFHNSGQICPVRLPFTIHGHIIMPFLAQLWSWLRVHYHRWPLRYAAFAYTLSGNIPRLPIPIVGRMFVDDFRSDLDNARIESDAYHLMTKKFNIPPEKISRSRATPEHVIIPSEGIVSPIWGTWKVCAPRNSILCSTRGDRHHPSAVDISASATNRTSSKHTDPETFFKPYGYERCSSHFRRKHRLVSERNLQDISFLESNQRKNNIKRSSFKRKSKKQSSSNRKIESRRHQRRDSATSSLNDALPMPPSHSAIQNLVDFLDRSSMANSQYDNGESNRFAPSNLFQDFKSFSLTDRCPIALIEYLEQHPTAAQGQIGLPVKITKVFRPASEMTKEDAMAKFKKKLGPFGRTVIAPFNATTKEERNSQLLYTFGTPFKAQPGGGVIGMVTPISNNILYNYPYREKKTAKSFDSLTSSVASSRHHPAGCTDFLLIRTNHTHLGTDNSNFQKPTSGESTRAVFTDALYGPLNNNEHMVFLRPLAHDLFSGTDPLANCTPVKSYRPKSGIDLEGITDMSVGLYACPQSHILPSIPRPDDIKKHNEDGKAWLKAFTALKRSRASPISTYNSSLPEDPNLFDKGGGIQVSSSTSRSNCGGSQLSSSKKQSSTLLTSESTRSTACVRLIELIFKYYVFDPVALRKMGLALTSDGHSARSQNVDDWSSLLAGPILVPGQEFTVLRSIMNIDTTDLHKICYYAVYRLSSMGMQWLRLPDGVPRAAMLLSQDDQKVAETRKTFAREWSEMIHNIRRRKLQRLSGLSEEERAEQEEQLNQKFNQEMALMNKIMAEDLTQLFTGVTFPLNWGVTNLRKPHNPLTETNPHPTNAPNLNLLSQTANFIESELQTTPWQLGSEILDVASLTHARFALYGLSDPSGGRGEAVAVMRKLAGTKRRGVVESSISSEQLNSLVKAGEDLRKFSLQELTHRLVSVGVPQATLTRLTRWSMVGLLRNIQTNGASALEEHTLNANNKENSGPKEHDHAYLEAFNNILRRQCLALGTDAPQFSDDEDMVVTLSRPYGVQRNDDSFLNVDDDQLTLDFEAMTAEDNSCLMDQSMDGDRNLVNSLPTTQQASTADYLNETSKINSKPNKSDDNTVDLENLLFDGVDNVEDELHQKSIQNDEVKQLEEYQMLWGDSEKQDIAHSVKMIQKYMGDKVKTDEWRNYCETPTVVLKWVRKYHNNNSNAEKGEEQVIYICGEKAIGKFLKWRQHRVDKQSRNLRAHMERVSALGRWSRFSKNKGNRSAGAVNGWPIGTTSRSCRKCGQVGHISSNPACPFNVSNRTKKGNSSKSFVNNSTSSAIENNDSGNSSVNVQSSSPITKATNPRKDNQSENSSSNAMLNQITSSGGEWGEHLFSNPGVVVRYDSLKDDEKLIEEISKWSSAEQSKNVKKNHMLNNPTSSTAMTKHHYGGLAVGATSHKRMTVRQGSKLIKDVKLESNNQQKQSNITSERPKYKWQYNQQARETLNYRLKRIITTMEAKKSMRESWKWFWLPVSEEIAPNYGQIIKNPLSVSEILDKTKKNLYKNLNDFESDLKLVWNNSVLYNGEGHFVTSHAKILEQGFNELIEEPNTNNFLKICAEAIEALPNSPPNIKNNPKPAPKGKSKRMGAKLKGKGKNS